MFRQSRSNHHGAMTKEDAIQVKYNFLSTASDNSHKRYKIRLVSMVVTCTLTVYGFTVLFRRRIMTAKLLPVQIAMRRSAPHQLLQLTMTMTMMSRQ